jgi:hypothetical protein
MEPYSMDNESAIHPDVEHALAESGALIERLLDAVDKMRSLTAERLSKDGDIAVKADMSGQLIDLWFKPGLLDRKDPRAIAKEVTALAVAAAQAAAAEVDQIFRDSRDSDDDVRDQR